MSGSDDLIAHEAELWAAAMEHFGDQVLEVLQEIATGFPSFEPLSAQVIHFVEPGPMIDALRRVRTNTDGPVVDAHRDGSGRLFMTVRHRAWLASALFTRLPAESLPKSLIDRRFAADVGL